MKILPNRTIPAGDPKAWQAWRWMRIEHPETGLYLLRLYVLRTPKGGLMVHYLAGPDTDRHGHDHPWGGFRSFILRGGYVEHVHDVEDGKAVNSRIVGRRRWRTHRFPENSFHRITSVFPGTVTAVLHGPKRRDWGFFDTEKGEKVVWHEYLNGAR